MVDLVTLFKVILESGGFIVMVLLFLGRPRTELGVNSCERIPKFMEG